MSVRSEMNEDWEEFVGRYNGRYNKSKQMDARSEAFERHYQDGGYAYSLREKQDARLWFFAGYDAK